MTNERFAEYSIALFFPPISLTPICPTCGKNMKLHNAVKFESFCENCMAVYDRHGKKVKDVEVKE